MKETENFDRKFEAHWNQVTKFVKFMQIFTSVMIVVSLIVAIAQGYWIYSGHAKQDLIDIIREYKK